MVVPTASSRRRSSSASKRGGSGASVLTMWSMCWTLPRPLAEGLPGGEHVLQLVVAVEARVLEIDADGLARPDAALGDDARLVELHHARLAADDEQPVGGDRVAQRAQAVAVEARDHPAPVRGRDGGRAIPRLHHGVAVEEQVAVRLRHRRVLADAGRDQQCLGHGRVSPGAHQQLEHGVERRRVAAARLDHGLDAVQPGVERARGEPRLMALHPVHVAGQAC